MSEGAPFSHRNIRPFWFGHAETVCKDVASTRRSAAIGLGTGIRYRASDAGGAAASLIRGRERVYQYRSGELPRAGHPPRVNWQIYRSSVLPAKGLPSCTRTVPKNPGDSVIFLEPRASERVFAIARPEGGLCGAPSGSALAYTASSGESARGGFAPSGGIGCLTVLVIAGDHAGK
jgi:hypothetical protein